MSFCASCGNQFNEGDQFCAKCGTASKGGANPETAEAKPKTSRRGVLLASLFALPVWVLIIYFATSAKGCSSAEGNLVASGDPLGDFIFAPAECSSGEHESFFGVLLLGKHANAGRIKAIIDGRDGKFLDLELPGSCSGPDGGGCKVVRVEPSSCDVFDLKIVKTDTWVNRIQLLDGSLKLDCAFEGGGRAQADLKFESCD